MEETFLQLHERLLKDGVGYLTSKGVYIKSGLCVVDFPSMRNDLDSNETFRLFLPTEQDSEELKKELKETSYFGSESKEERRGEYTPLRQTIILFCAALNGEL